jgi:hypothetical protein
MSITDSNNQFAVCTQSEIWLLTNKTLEAQVLTGTY